MSLIHSQKPKRLARFIISDYCNYNCQFCCWQDSEKKGDHKQVHLSNLTPDDFSFLVNCFIQSGCDRFMLTGGEPFFYNKTRLLEIIKHVSNIKELNDFWITSNGSQLNNLDFLSELKNSGLNKIVLSIGAETNEKYKKYTQNNESSLDQILNNICKLKSLNYEVKVDVPLSTVGIKNNEELIILIEKLSNIGVNKLAYFKLHKTKENKSVFSNLFVDANLITNNFVNDSEWTQGVNSSGQTVFKKNGFEVIVPALNDKITSNCKKRKCGDYCQGIYACYVEQRDEDIIVRACHHEFSNHINEYRLTLKDIKKKNSSQVVDVLNKVWKFSYLEDES